jgi:hypothetical protein
MKDYLKSVKFIYKLNIIYKSTLTKFNYIAWCNKYDTPSILSSNNLRIWCKLFNFRQNDVRVNSSNYSVFYIGTNKDQDESGFIQALNKQCNLFRFQGFDSSFHLLFPSNSLTIEETRRLNGDKILEELNALLINNHIDLVIGQMWNYIVPNYVLNTIKEKGIKIVNIAMDDRHSFHLSKLVDGSDGGTFGLINSIDLFATAAPECVKFYNYYDKPSIFFPEASSDSIFYPTKCMKDMDIVFIGSNYGYRKTIVDFLQKKGLSVHCFGKGWDNGIVSIEESNNIFSRAKIILGIGGILHCTDFSALKLRDFDAPMSGSFYLTQFNPDLDIFYSIGDDIDIWFDLNDLYNKCVYYLNNEIERERIALSGLITSKSNNTWDKRLNYLFNEINQLL